VRREVELLLACSRSSIDAPQAERIRALLANELDWVYLIRFGSRHRLLPVVHRALGQVARDLVPRATFDALGRLCGSLGKASEDLLEEMFGLLEIFERQGIRAIPYKGPTLGYLAYGDPGARECSDLDIVVRPEDRERAVGVMQEAGFRFCKEADLHCALVRDKTLLEVHSEFFPKELDFRISVDEFWERTRVLTLRERRVSTLPIEDWVLVLSVHAAKHAFLQLSWIRDIAELIRQHDDLDWGRLVEMTKRSGCRRHVAIALALCGRLFDAPVPAGVRKELGCRWLIAVFGTTTARILCSEATTFVQLAQRFFTLLLVTGAGRAVRAVIRTNERDRAMVRLPRGLGFLYVFVRLWRVVKTYGRGARKQAECPR